MPSNRGKRKKSTTTSDGGEEDKRWKAAEIDMELMKEFESDGGLLIEEATDEVSVTYGLDGGTKPAGANKKAGDDNGDTVRKTKKRKRTKANETSSAERCAEISPKDNLTNRVIQNGDAGSDSLSRQLAEVRAAMSKVVESSTPEVEKAPQLAHWIEFDLHPALMQNIGRLGFQKPTEVQARCLTPAIRQRKDIVGAAETGSGKTLAFGLPILHHILNSIDASASCPSSKTNRSGEDDLKALAILPTRELAVQVRKHLNDAAQGTAVRTECMVGGMSMQKQKRLLGRQPSIVVGTPGRLFALMGLGQEADIERCDWLRRSLQSLRHLVLDEADRLVEAGHFRELDRILSLVYGSLARPQQLQTFVFSATLTLNPHDFKRRKKDSSSADKVAKLSERLQFREPRAVHIVDLNGPGGSSNSTQNHVKALAANQKESDGDVVPNANSKNSLLPEQLALREAICADDKEKESVLTAWLLKRYRWESPGNDMTATGDAKKVAETGIETKAGGRIVLFVNAISSVLRLTPILALLLESPSAEQVLAKVQMSQGRQHPPSPSVYVLGLHSRMQQKDRLKRIERFRCSEHAILVCTDVAARGLDVKEISSVLHFHMPRNAETFVHRSGRTARAGRRGESVVFMGPGDHAQWQRLCHATGISKDRITSITINALELSAARETSRLAVELESKVHRAAKQKSDRSWLKKVADEAELMLDEDSDDADESKDAAPRKALWGLWQQLQARVRLPPKRVGAGPVGRRRKR